MKTTLIIFFLTVRSSYSADAEEAATAEAIDTVQFHQLESGGWRIKTYAMDQDVHVWSLGKVDDIVSLAKSNTEKHYGDVLAEAYILESRSGIDGLRQELAVRGLSTHLEISDSGFVFWAPEGTRYRTKSTPQ
jgi:hypothetical protein